MNVLQVEVRGGVARANELEFPAPDHPDGKRLQIGFRPYAVQISPDLEQFRYRAVLHRTYFLGIMLRVELELPSGLLLRSRMTKEEYAQLGLHDGRAVSFQIRTYRLLAGEDEALGPEVHARYEAPPTIGEHI
jgi:hypothetical protein